MLIISTEGSHVVIFSFILNYACYRQIYKVIFLTILSSVCCEKQLSPCCKLNFKDYALKQTVKASAFRVRFITLENG